MAKYQDTPGSATEAQRLNFGYGQTALIESERIKRQTIANPLAALHNKNRTTQRLSYFKHRLSQ
jgi:hypothetical protein